MDIRRSKRSLLGTSMLSAFWIVCCVIAILRIQDPFGVWFTLLFAGLGVAALVPSVILYFRDTVIGSIDENGFGINYWGTGQIPWSEISAFKPAPTGGPWGGVALYVYLHNPRRYTSKMNAYRLLLYYLRILIGHAGLTVYPLGIDLPMDTLIERFKRRVPERGL